MTKEELEKENAELTERLLKVENAYKKKFADEWRLNELYGKLQTDFANAEKCSREYFTRYRVMLDYFIKAKEIIKELVRVEYADFTNGDYSKELSKVLEQAEQFLNEAEK